MFCQDFSTIVEPITCLTRKDIPFVWGPEQQVAQETIIQHITNSPVLTQPDPSKQFELETDALQIGTGAILYQCDPPITLADGTMKPGVTFEGLWAPYFYLPSWPLSFSHPIPRTPTIVSSPLACFCLVYLYFHEVLLSLTSW
jgi:hypothetical protein